MRQWLLMTSILVGFAIACSSALRFLVIHLSWDFQGTFCAIHIFLTYKTLLALPRRFCWSEIRSILIESIIDFVAKIYQYIISIHDQDKESCKGSLKIHVAIISTIVAMMTQCNQSYYRLDDCFNLEIECISPKTCIVGTCPKWLMKRLHCRYDIMIELGKQSKFLFETLIFFSFLGSKWISLIKYSLWIILVVLYIHHTVSECSEGVRKTSVRSGLYLHGTLFRDFILRCYIPEKSWYPRTTSKIYVGLGV